MKVLIKDSEFIAYLAGIIDSDGSIGISRRAEKLNAHGYSYREVVQITWKRSEKTKKFLSDLKTVYGGSVGEYTGGFNNATNTVRWSVDGKGAEAVARDVLPYLRLKKKQAEYVLEMRSVKGVRYGNGNRKPQSVWEIEDKIYKNALTQRSRLV